jgi:hypothetical protein
MPTTTRTTRRIFAPGRTPAAVVTTAPGDRGGLPSLAPPPPATSRCCCPACVGLECLDRTRYFSGQLLTEADLNNEQSYWLAKNRLHNRYLHGWGVVCGLQVVCNECDGWVTIKSGYAIDPCGNDIIVCSDYPFNVVKAIQACCTPTQQAGNCAPLRSTPPDNCKDPQHWCITIEYQEQPSRLVTPLKKAKPKSSTCSCASAKGGCGCGCECGCGGHGSNGSSASSSNGCSCASTATQSPSVPAGACEPTRINEGYRVCVVPEHTTSQVPRGSLRGTAAYQVDSGIQELQQLLLQAPQLDPNKPNAITDPKIAFSTVSNYLTTIKSYFTTPGATHCSTVKGLGQIVVQAPPQETSNYIAQQLVPIMSQLSGVVINSAFQRYCIPLLLPCPPDPCDDRVCLACVTVQDGKVIDICNFGCRHQVFTFQTLYSWLSAFGLDRILLLWKRRFEIDCCGETTPLFSPSMFQRQSLTSAGLTNPGMVNQLFSTFVAQKLGSAFINSVLPSSQGQTVDLRPLVGLSTDDVKGALERYKISSQNITPIDVGTDPTWNDDAIAASAQLAPATFLPTDHLTMFVKGNLVVGFDVTDPVSVLRNQVQQLEQQVNQLTGGAGSPAPEHLTGRGPTKKRKRHLTP